MKNRTPVIILHFSPIELYPPVMNLLNFMKDKFYGRPVIVITTRLTEMGIRPLDFSGLCVLRKGISGNHLSRFSRISGYFSFYLSAVWILLRFRPSAVLYFETLSSLPAVLCRFLFKRGTGLLVHYHEYVSPEEVSQGSALFRFLYKNEKRLLPLACWISQTNEGRLDLFKKDFDFLDKARLHVLPNYPPSHWKNFELKREAGIPYRVVYVGSLSMETLYLKEFASWVIAQEGHVLWDIYSISPDARAVEYLTSLHSEYISLKGSVDYESLPKVLRSYQAGVILYKGHIPNYVLNAPNKLFEYHVNGLDVWFPSVMSGSLSYVTHGSFPKITALDFEQLGKYNFSDLISREGLAEKPGKFSCDDVLPELITALQNDR